MNEQVVLTERRNQVLLITLNAPQKRNSLQAPGLVQSLLAALEQLEHDDSLGAAVLTGAGGAFCSGGDLQQLSANTEQQTRKAMQQNAAVYRRLALSDKLIVAAVDGPAYGAGLGLALACDWVVAGKKSVFCSAFTRVGAMPDAALFWSLPARVGIAQARRMMLGATELTAKQAGQCGLADEWSDERSGLELALPAAARFAAGPRRALGRIKTGLRRAPMSIEQALDFQLDNAPALFAGPEFQEGAKAFLEKRTPVFNNGQNKS
ncbi:enoyl-CoA hydratase/isomerase family protein [Alcaligenes endophyticus]|uniref:Enoyl-CoA hydratase/isomerase family protein n=1 Tax=Alcaligenes endophyticus TaxID=1929088 RepID=A0ABT8EJF4_9BURK|nr:enoyl-CoA hydratase/isomerase family protein [Alcaligenes endophyticus]MCX5591752.1 enoyl-CoA hydratase/isomerase family protein [Alcaligenes endophyticus]MDN4121429.1 enoyl-CoA hydratase/isomerase family protein [Alcaligenes endophyticus]